MVLGLQYSMLFLEMTHRCTHLLFTQTRCGSSPFSNHSLTSEADAVTMNSGLHLLVQADFGFCRLMNHPVQTGSSLSLSSRGRLLYPLSLKNMTLFFFFFFSKIMRWCEGFTFFYHAKSLWWLCFSTWCWVLMSDSKDSCGCVCVYDYRWSDCLFLKCPVCQWGDLKLKVEEGRHEATKGCYSFKDTSSYLSETNPCVNWIWHQRLKPDYAAINVLCVCPE